MRIVKTSTISHLNNRRKVVFRPSSEVLLVFSKLNQILRPYESFMDAVADTEYHYELWTNNGYRTSSFYPKRKRGIQFAALLLYERYVGLYFLPLYISEQIRRNLSSELEVLLTGQSCFHFNELPDQLEQQVKVLLREGWDFYKTEEIVTGATRRRK